jgi:folate-binding protein YgfZ
MPFGLINKSVLIIKGENAASLLDGLITNDIKLASQDQPIFTLFLNNKGRVLFSSIIYMIEQNTYALEIEDNLLMELAKHIHKYDLTKKVEFSKADDLQIAISDTKHDNLTLDPRSNKLGYRGLIAKDTLDFDATFAQEYENTRLKLTIPGNTDFIKEKSLANDLNLEELNGISFTKGCYLGQEITSKTKHIRETKNKLITLDNNKHKVEKTNCEIFLDDTKVGQTFSFNNQFVLAIIKRNILETDNLIIK